ncbi:MAG: AbrB/MazE/SpoVT family DNA-binding domain-containing protein [Deltaproteobacteria bacterium]|nr:AbrB/MazE/SpoVT family DNA-binding domain-containing protein [Deltaproteobacteria bacterium]
MPEETRLTSKGQVVIPKKVRERLRWRPGTRLQVHALPGGAVELRQAEPEQREVGLRLGL